MMKRNVAELVCALFVLISAAGEKLKLQQNISLEFKGCADSSIQFEARGPNAKAPMESSELKKQFSNEPFIRNADKTYTWQNYTIAAKDTGYTLFCNGKELYTATFNIEADELKEVRVWKDAQSFYGMGEASKKVNLADQRFTMYNESKYGDHAYLFIPFYITDTNTSVYYNANGKDEIYFQSGVVPQTYTTSYQRIQCYVRQNKNMQEGIAHFYAETNPNALLPKWAYGYIQSKYGYRTQQEVIDVVEGFKQRNLPLTGIVLDLFWFNKMGDIFWDTSRFPNPKQLNEYLEANGVKLITITEPFYTTSSTNFEEYKKDDLLCKNKFGKIVLWRDWWCLGDKEGGILNPLAKNATKTLGEKYGAMLDSGIDGFWTDLGEPEKAPASLQFGKLTEQDFHNYYNYYWSKAVYEGVQKKYPDKRLMILSRSGYTGSGKFNVSVWSGDVSVSWTALSQQTAFALNAGMCALPYWGSDTGGFAQQEAKSELFVRWHEFSAFTPVYRAHGSGPREPWIFSDVETGIVRKYLDIRTALLPYIYSTAHQTANGLPMMRPLFYEDTSAPAEFVESEFLFGDALLVAPVTEELSKSTTKKVWLPKGTWYDFETLQKAAGKETITIEVPLEKIPVYIKEGAIIPAEKDGTTYIFMIPAAGVTNTFTLYNDDGETNKYKDGAFAETRFLLNGTSLTASVQGDAAFAPKSVTLVVPSSFTDDSSWKTDGLYKTKTVQISELAAEYSLY